MKTRQKWSIYNLLWPIGARTNMHKLNTLFLLVSFFLFSYPKVQSAEVHENKKHESLRTISELIQANTDSLEFKPATFFSKEIRSESNSVLQKTMDKALLLITSHSELGRQIAKFVLHCNKEAIINHLGASAIAAEEISKICSQEFFLNRHKFILPSPLNALDKLSRRVNWQKKTYSLILTNRTTMDYDSWTSSLTNRTTLVVYHDRDKSELNLSHLTQLLAHELAIYFDAKFWIDSEDWKMLYSLNKITENYESKTKIALNNPLINQVFIYSRAFTVEKYIVEDLVNQGLLTLNSPSYYKNNPYFFFNKNSCLDLCVYENIMKMSYWYIPNSLPLLAFSPQYRSLKWMEIIHQSPSFDEKQMSSLNNFLNDIPLNFISTYVEMDALQILEMQSLGGLGNFSDTIALNHFFKTVLLPQDLQQLKEAMTLQSSATHQSRLLIQMIQPSLSGYNVKLSSGPRPRIKTGGGL